MEVLLAGYNLDIDTIGDLKQFIEKVARKKESDGLRPEAISLLARDNLTPETLSAAYARISRNPRPVNELRAIAREEVDKARKSNRNIIFGLGHSSVAEHAVFNFDVLGISRLAVEDIEHFRLASYTEKSQRYILFKDDFYVPQELRQCALEEQYTSLIRRQYQAYHKFYERLLPWFLDQHPEHRQSSAEKHRIEGLAKEDARYIISLATQTQLGITVNARSLENIIVKCASSPLEEVREYSRRLYSVCKSITPSIVKYVDPGKYLSDKTDDLQKIIQSVKPATSTVPADDVLLLNYPTDADERILSAILFRYSNQDFRQCLEKCRLLSFREREQFFREIFRHIKSWDSVLREFELIEFTFQLTVSAGNYGQLKRHRMASILPQPYDIGLDPTIPHSILQTGQKDKFLQLIEQTNAVYKKIVAQQPHIASYVLTNAHRRRVLFKINLRELYHFCRLREDAHAQWDIRQTAKQIHRLVADKLPLSGSLLGGKDAFPYLYQKLFSH